MEAQSESLPPTGVRLAVLSALSRQLIEAEPTDVAESVGAAVHIDPQTDTRTAFYFGGNRLEALGAALRWSAVHKPDALHITMDPQWAGDAARRAELLSTPGPVQIWESNDGSFTPVEASPLLPPPVLPESFGSHVELIRQAGAEPVLDHGRLVAEVAGLEVARVQIPATMPGESPDLAEDIALLEIGVGQADRELHHMIQNSPLASLDNEDKPGDTAQLRNRLAQVVDAVRAMRTGSGEHPLSRVALQRWVRSEIVAQPSLIGAKEVTYEPPLRPENTVLSRNSVAAVGIDDTDRPLVVVCSVGVDLNLAADIVDYRHRINPDAHVRVVTPERDLYLVEPMVKDLVSNVSVFPAPQR